MVGEEIIFGIFFSTVISVVATSLVCVCIGENEKNIFRKEKAKVEELLKKKSDDFTELENQKKDVSKRLYISENSLIKREKKFDDLEREKWEIESEKLTLQQRLTEISNEKNSLTRNLQQSKDKLDKTENSFSEAKKELDGYKNDITKLSTELTQTEISLKNAEEKIGALEGKIDVLHKEEKERISKLYEGLYEDLEKSRSQNRITKFDLIKSLERISELGEKLEKWQKELGEIEIDCRNLQEKKESLKRIVEILTSSSEEKEKMNKLQEEIKNLERELLAKKEYIDNLERELSATRQELKEKKIEVEKVKKELEESEKKHKEKVKELKKNLEESSVQKGKKEYNLHYDKKHDKELSGGEIKKLDDKLNKSWEELEKEIKKKETEAVLKVKLESLLVIISKLEKKEESAKNVIKNYYFTINFNQANEGAMINTGNIEIKGKGHSINMGGIQNQELQSQIQTPPK